MAVLVLGIAPATRWRASVWLASVIVGIFGLFHGYAHGFELPSMANPTAFGAGYMLATGMLHLFGIAVGEFCLRAHAEGVLRVLGGAVGLSGIYNFAQALGA